MTKTIAEKISKIIAKADSTTNDTEADIFMAKAHAMLEAHGLSLLDLGKLDSENPLGQSNNVYTSSDGWKDKVAFKLAAYYGCELVTVPYGRARKHYVTFGRESARITFELMLPFVLKQVARIANREFKKGNYASPARAHTAIAGATATRLTRLIWADREREPVGHGVNALVPVDMIQQLRDEAFPSAKPSKAKNKHDFNAQEAAKEISLHQQAGKVDDEQLKLENQG